MSRLGDILRSAGPHSPSANGDTDESPAPPAVEDEDACPHCGGAGFVRRNVPLDHPEFGRALPCSCVQAESREERLGRLERYSNIGPLIRLTFDNLISRGRSADPRDQARFQRCVNHAKAFAEDPQGWFVMVGASGCGKTHVAAAVANRCIERGQPALFVVVPDLLDHLRAAYGPDSDVTYDQLSEQVRNAPVLVLDDLGTQSATPWAEEKLFQIINHRYNARLPTVVTTNVSLSKLDDRMRSRLGDPSLVQPHADPIATVHELEERRPPEYRELNMLEFPMIREMTFDTFDLHDVRTPRDRDLRQNAYQQALHFASKLEGWMVFFGDRSRDRTHLIAAIANYAGRSGESPLLVQVADLLDFLRHALRPEEDGDIYRIKRTLRSCPLLLLDDLEIGMGSDWVRGELFQLLNPRYLARLPTVITTRHTINDLQRDTGWERLARLLIGDPNFCSVVPIGEFSNQQEQAPATKPRKRQPSRRTR